MIPSIEPVYEEVILADGPMAEQSVWIPTHCLSFHKAVGIGAWYVYLDTGEKARDGLRKFKYIGVK